MSRLSLAMVAAVSLVLLPSGARAQIHAMVNYETKSPESLKVLKSPVAPAARKEGIAIIDVDPKSKTFGKIVQDLPLPAELVAHHIFYNRDQSKAYITALGKPELRVIDMKKKPYQIKVVAVPDCSVGEDVVFSEDNTKWYLSCMGSQAMIVGDARSDEPIKMVKVPAPYPHGIAIHNGIDRVLLSSTVRASDLGDAGEVISVVEASTGKALGTHKVSKKPSPAGAAPVEILFVPKANPPVAYITNMYEGTLWTATWNPVKKEFECCFDLRGDDLPETIELGVVHEPVLLGGHGPRLCRRIEPAHGRVVALPAVPADECVPEDSEEPRLEIGAGRELTGCLKRPRVGLLDEVIRVRVIAGEVAGEVVEHVGIRQSLLTQRARIPGLLDSVLRSIEYPGHLGKNHGVRNNSPMNSGQLMISRAFAPRRLKAATPRPSTNVTADRSNRTCPFS